MDIRTYIAISIVTFVMSLAAITLVLYYHVDREALAKHPVRKLLKLLFGLAFGSLLLMSILTMAGIAASTTANAATPYSNLSSPHVIEIFALHSQRLTGIKAAQQQGIDVRVFYVDDVDRIQQKLSNNLPGTAKIAQQVIFERMAKDPGLAKRLSAAWRSRVLAEQYKLRSLPSMVFDRDSSSAVNQVNVIKAIAIYRQQQKSMQKP